MIRTHLWLPLTCLLFSACDEGKQEAGQSPDVELSAKPEGSENEIRHDPDSYIQPLWVGRVDRYQMHEQVGNRPAESYLQTLTIKEMKEIKGKSYFVLHVDTGGFPGLDNRVEYYRIGEDGYYMISDKDETMTEFLVLPRPLPEEVGMTWEVHAPGKDPQISRVIGYETLELRGRTYESCLKLRRESEFATTTWWVAKGVGDVKIVVDFGNAVLVLIRVPPEEEHKKTAAGSDPTAAEVD